MLAIFVVIGDEFRAAQGIDISWGTLIFYTDRLVWIGLTLTLFPHAGLGVPIGGPK